MSQTIFVLEDDPVSRGWSSISWKVRDSRYAFSTPVSLISDAERQAPCLVLLDIMVPGGDGLEVCRKLRAHPGCSSVPIIFVTARAGENDRVLGLELGADDYITKPFAMRELVARVKAYYDASNVRLHRPSSALKRSSSMPAPCSSRCAAS